MECIFCGQVLEEGAISCPKCGRPVGAETPPPAGNSSTNLAMWAHLGPLLVNVVAFFLFVTGAGPFFGALGFLPALLIMKSQKADVFAKSHAKESLNFQLFWLLMNTLATISIITTLGLALFVLMPLGICIGLYNLFQIYQAIVGAQAGRYFRYNFVRIRFVK